MRKMLYRSHPIFKAPMEVEKIYQMDAALTENQILLKYEASRSGLTQKEVVERIEKYGINEVLRTKKIHWYTMLLSAMRMWASL